MDLWNDGDITSGVTSVKAKVSQHECSHFTIPSGDNIIVPQQLTVTLGGKHAAAAAVS